MLLPRLICAYALQVNDAGAGAWLSLPDLLTCEKSQLEAPNAVQLVDRAQFVAQALESEAQLVDCRPEDEFLGMKASAPVAGHLRGACNVPFEDIFAADSGDGSMFILHQQELRALFEANGIAFDAPVAVVAANVAEAAAVATALLISGHESVLLCSASLDEELVSQLPEAYTQEIFSQDALVLPDGEGKFDLSPNAGDAAQTDSEEVADAAKELGKMYAERMNGKDEFGDKVKRADPKKRGQESPADEVVWIAEGRRYFDMPSPVTKREFLDASNAIYRVVSFVLAPFGFPESLHEKLTLSEVKTQCGSLFQDVIEVCSDLIYQHRGLTEGAMAMSVHKWVEEVHDGDCTNQVKAINEIWRELYDPPRVVEVPDLDEKHVLEIAAQLKDKMLEQVHKRTPWAFDKIEVEEEKIETAEESNVESKVVEDEMTEDEPTEEAETHDESTTTHSDKGKEEKKQDDVQKEADKTDIELETDELQDEGKQDKEDNLETDKSELENDTATTEDATSHVNAGEPDAKPEKGYTIDDSTPWSCMYPTTVYTLGFIPRDSEDSLRKLSTLQIKSFIQAVAEAAWDVIGDVDHLNSVQFEALCETLKEESLASLEACKADTEDALYVMKHFLTRSSAIEEAHVSSLFSVRDALNDGNRKLRSGRHVVALAAYAKAFEHLPIYDKSLDKVLVGRSGCFIELDQLSRAKTEAEIALKLNPFSAGAYNCLGKVEEKSSHPHEAMQHFVTSFILDGSRSQEHAESIDRVSRLVGRDVAKSRFDEMVKVHELPSAWLVDSYFESFEHDADYAIALPSDIAKKADTDQSDVDALSLLHRAVFHKRNKDFGDMQRDVWALVSMDMDAAGLTPPQQALALNLHASLLYVVGDVHAAVEVITKSLELHPASVNGLVKKGGFLAEIGKTDEATSCFSEAMELDPNDADVYLHMGQMELLDGNYQAAVQVLRRCISRSDALPVTRVSYGMALYKSGSIYQANDVFDEAVAAFPESAEVHLFHGEVLADQGDYALAMRRFLRALELSPQCPLPFLNAGRVYVGTNDPMRAIAHFEQALEIDPRCSSAHLDIAQVLFAQGRTREAFEHFEAAAACCRFLPEVEEVCSCQEMAKMQLKVTEILGVELRHIMRSK